LLPIFAVILAAACVRFTPPVLDEPFVVLERAVFCSSLDQKDNWAEPAGEKAIFKKGTDANVYSFLELRDLRGAHTLLWKWYDPSRRLYRETEGIAVGENGKIFDRYIAWDLINVTEGKENGVWTVAVFMDGRLFASKEFEIREN
jgi:hypothetical protein